MLRVHATYQLTWAAGVATLPYYTGTFIGTVEPPGLPGHDWWQFQDRDKRISLLNPAHVASITPT